MADTDSDPRPDQDPQGPRIIPPEGDDPLEEDTSPHGEPARDDVPEEEPEAVRSPYEDPLELPLPAMVPGREPLSREDVDPGAEEDAAGEATGEIRVAEETEPPPPDDGGDVDWSSPEEHAAESAEEEGEGEEGLRPLVAFTDVESESARWRRNSERAPEPPRINPPSASAGPVIDSEGHGTEEPPPADEAIHEVDDVGAVTDEVGDLPPLIKVEADPLRGVEPKGTEEASEYEVGEPAGDDLEPIDLERGDPDAQRDYDDRLDSPVDVAARHAESEPGPSPLIKVGTGIGFGVIVLIIILVLKRPGLAGLAVALITWVSLEYFGVMYKATVDLEQAIEGEVPLTSDATVEVSESFVPREFRTPPAGLVCVAATFAMSLLAYLEGVEAVGVVTVFAVVGSVLWFLGSQHRGQAPLEVAVSLSGLVHVGVLGSFALLILRGPHGMALLIAIIVMTVVNDVAAYGVGASFGHRALVPQVSPNKSLEGFLGGTAATFVAAAVVVLLEPIHDVSVLGDWKIMLVLAAVISIFGVLGDLSESLIKRSLDIKDVGSFLPGHGGMFDRVDALLFVMPASFVTLWIMW